METQVTSRDTWRQDRKAFISFVFHVLANACLVTQGWRATAVTSVTNHSQGRTCWRSTSGSTTTSGTSCVRSVGKVRPSLMQHTCFSLQRAPSAGSCGPAAMLALQISCGQPAVWSVAVLRQPIQFNSVYLYIAQFHKLQICLGVL